MNMIHHDNKRPIFVLKTNKNPDRYSAYYTDRALSGPWFEYVPTAAELTKAEAELKARG